jgi:hypothetical protein
MVWWFDDQGFMYAYEVPRFELPADLPSTVKAIVEVR